MSAEETHNYEGQLIEWVVIQEIRPGRLIVKPQVGRMGFIPEREWAWDRSIKRHHIEFRIGDRIPAVAINKKNKAAQTYYSICERSDPWANISKYRLKMPVVAEIISMRSYGLFVQIEPGIIAAVWNESLPLMTNEIPTDKLSVGDKLCGLITEINPENKTIEINVNEYLTNLSEEVLNVRMGSIERHLSALFKKDSSDNTFDNQLILQKNTHSIPPLPRIPERILVIENDEHYGQALNRVLYKEYKARVDLATNAEQARSLFIQNSYDLIVMDIELSTINNTMENGIQLAREFFLKKGKFNLVFCSGSDRADEGLSDIIKLFENEIPYVYKTEENKDKVGLQLINAIEDLMQGKIKHVSAHVDFSKQSQQWLEEINQIPFEESLNLQLRNLVEQNNLAHAFIIEVIDRLRTTKILAQYHTELAGQHAINLDLLYISQIRQVVEKNEEVYFTYINPEQTNDAGTFRNLFPMFFYRSCFGVPIQLTGRVSSYALFVLERKYDYLDSKIREKVSLSSHKIGTIIERNAVQEVLQKTQISYTKGQLLGSLIHELNNKIFPISQSINSALSKLKANSVTEGIGFVIDFKQKFDELSKLFVAYSRLAKYSMDEIQLNDIIIKVEKQLEIEAKGIKNRTKIFVRTEQNLPLIYGNALQIEQILTNLVLNAIQNIGIQLDYFRTLEEHNNYNFENLPTNGCIFIHSAYEKRSNTCQIMVYDSGPGISNEWSSKIFEWGESTRDEGQGMGLYISRSLARAMQGRLILASTIRYIGSAFLLEFPVKIN
jgi:signal transduction histidine kinase/CheY-like chemotaxis protein